MVPAQLPDLSLSSCIVLRSENIVHPPFVAGSGAEHAAHQMIPPIRMGESVKRIVIVHAKAFGRNENRPTGA